MKITLPLFLFVCLLSLSAYSMQDSTQVPKKEKMEHDININTTFFFKQIISLSNANLEISPYIVGYKFFPVKHHGIRFAIGGNFSSHTQNTDSTFTQITKISSVDYRLGYEYRRSFGKRWSFFAGVDLINSFSTLYSRVNSDFDIVTTSDKTWTIGGGPVIGIQINISKRIALFTETAFYYTYSSTKDKVTSLNFPELNHNRVTDIQQTGKFLLPTSLFFVFRF
ncbi:MAG: hypothetical protein JWO03_2538 [Bacteroidetes bacterium]|nr:hypothetical protein [Bacteroidota bacterium]